MVHGWGGGAARRGCCVHGGGRGIQGFCHRLMEKMVGGEGAQGGSGVCCRPVKEAFTELQRGFATGEKKGVVWGDWPAMVRVEKRG